MWCVPDLAAEFVERMEDVLRLYARKFDEKEPVVCLDERPVVLREDARRAVPMKPGRLARRDYEYVRCGTANVFCIVEPLTGRRLTFARPEWRSATRGSYAGVPCLDRGTARPSPVHARRGRRSVALGGCRATRRILRPRRRRLFDVLRLVSVSRPLLAPISRDHRLHRRPGRRRYRAARHGAGIVRAGDLRVRLRVVVDGQLARVLPFERA